VTTEIDAPEVAAAATSPVIGEGDRIELLDHGFVRLDASMADDLSVANAARVSFARRKEELDDADRGLIRFLMRDRHGTPFEQLVGSLISARTRDETTLAVCLRLFALRGEIPGVIKASW
jgi:hypothetical protein